MEAATVEEEPVAGLAVVGWAAEGSEAVDWEEAARAEGATVEEEPEAGSAAVG